MTLRSWMSKLLNPTLRSAQSKGRRHRQAQRPKRFLKIWLEALEDRLAPAVITVMNTNDSGANSLRQAILSSAVGDMINFAPGLAGQTITLTSGQLVINHSLTITGLGANQLAVSGNNASRVFNITTGTVQITGLTIENGLTNAQGGGGILNSGTLTLMDSAITGNLARGADGTGGQNGGYGGGIANTGNLTIIRSTLSGNTAVGGAGQAGQFAGGGGGGGGGFGGGIETTGGTVHIINSTLSGNFATGGVGGASAYPNGHGSGSGGLGGNHDTVTGQGGNSKYNSYGGTGLYFGGGGGGGYAYSTTVYGGGGAGGFGGGGGGGGGRTAGGVGGNGGIGGTYGGYGGSALNSSGGGGGGGAGIGGALFNNGGTVTITSSTIANNTATGGAGGTSGSNPGLPGQGVGGAIFNFLPASGSITVDSSIIAKNLVAGPSTNINPNLSGTVTDSGFNLVDNTTGSTGFTAGTDLLGVDPLLLPLGNNGGPTQTMGLGFGSPAIDHGDNATAPMTDQRGFTRIINGTEDIGAFEDQIVDTKPASPQSVSEGTSQAINAGSFTDAAPGVSSWMVTINWGDGSPNTVATFTSQGAITGITHNYAEEGTFTITIQVSDALSDTGQSTATVSVTDPQVQGTPANVNFMPNVQFSGPVATFTDPGSAEPNDGTHYSASINWGDNTAPTAGTITFMNGTFTVSGNHTYNSAGPFTITVTINHELATPATVLSSAGSTGPVMVTPPSNQNVGEGTSQLFNLGSFSDTSNGPWTVTVNWGDGTANTTLHPTTMGSLGSQPHTYAEEGTYTVTVAVTDTGDNQSGTGMFQVSVSDPNVIATGGFPFSALAGTLSATQPVATFTDPGSAEANDGTHYSASINWGDGTAATVGTISLAGATFTVSGNHTYAASGNYTITVTVNHEGSTPQTVTDTATVMAVNVLATGGFTFSAVEGAAASPQTIATFTDPAGPGALSDYSASINWGDGSTVTAGTITLSGTTFTVMGSHTYGEEGSAPITVTINHKTTTPQTVTDTATVSDPAVSGIVVAVGATAGSPFFNQAVASFTDPGGAEPNLSDPAGTIANHYKIVSISWGDNTPLDTSTGTLSYGGSPGSQSNPFTVSGSHVYAAAGTYTIVVSINHEGVPSTLMETATVMSLGQFAQGAQTKTSAFWAVLLGQELIRRFSLTAGGQSLGQWLASTFPKLYGGVGGAANLSNFTGAQVGAFYLGLFSQHNTTMLGAEVMATALYVFATTSSLGGLVAASPPYSLFVNSAGLGAYFWNIGFNGAAFGVPNFVALNVYQILQAANNFAIGGEPWGMNTLLRNEALSVFMGINGEGHTFP